jgi:hypothetical protein
MKIWISKYALSGGITEHECAPPEQGESSVYPGKPFAEFYGFKLGTEAHTSRAEAVVAAEAARVKKIASLRAQIAKLEKLSF